MKHIRPLPSQDLACPDPEGCPVVDRLPTLRVHLVDVGSPMFRVYDATWGYDEPNPGYGDARFSPFDDPATGRRVPTMYVAESPTAALLETVFHEVHHRARRMVYERDLRDHLLAHLIVPVALRLGDLRDAELRRHGLERSQIVASPAEHYPCTRRLAVRAYAARRSRPLDGLVWHSRQAELTDEPPAEVAVVFCDRYNRGRGGWVRTGPGSTNLLEGPGRVLVDELAGRLDATVQPEV